MTIFKNLKLFYFNLNYIFRSELPKEASVAVPDGTDNLSDHCRG